MTADEFDRTLAGWIDAESRSRRPISGIERVLDESRRRRPRPAWLATLGSHWVGRPAGRASDTQAPRLARLDLGWSAVAIALTLILAVVAGAVLIGQQARPVPATRDGRLAFVRDGAVFLADPDGRDPVRISPEPNGAESCDNVYTEGRMWAPDGRHLAYRSGWGQGCGLVVHIVDALGSQTAAFPTGDGWQVDWAPDGSRVATWGGGEGVMEIHRVDGALVSTLRLPNDFCICGDRDPTWAPGGASLLVKDLEIPLDGTTPAVLRAGTASGQVPVRSPSISADGSRFAFIAGGSLFVVPVDDRSAGRLVLQDPRLSDAVLSPDASQVAVWTSRDQILDAAGGLVSETEDLQVVDVATGHVTTLTTVSGNGAIKSIQFSADGTRILYRQVDAGGTPSLWSIGRDGSDARLLAPGATYGDWQPATP